MKQSFILLGAAGILFGMLAMNGCTVNDAQPSSAATVQGNFFPLENGILYSYVRTAGFSNSDTISCLLKSMTPYQDSLGTLYTFSYIKDPNGYTEAILSTDTSNLIALDGTLVPGASWIADVQRGIEASVVTQYDDYYLPGRQEHFSNVVEVKYHQSGLPVDSYTLRFFASGVGLILERDIAGQSNEVSRLQLIGLQYPS